MKRIIYLSFVLLLKCSSDNFRSITMGDYIVEGNITKDSIYNGLIKSYNKGTKKLFSECGYVNGIKNGEYKQFNDNGTLIEDLFYKDGKENGLAKLYNDNGFIYSQDYYFYGLRVGNSLKYENKVLKSYSFISLENTALMQFEYDSIRGHHLPDLIRNLYFYTSSNYSESVDDSLSKKTEYFLYTPNPPMQEFIYSLVKVDQNKKVLSTIQTFDNNQPWSKFDLDFNLDLPNSLYALKLRIIDTINNNNATIVRKLKYADVVKRRDFYTKKATQSERPF